MSNLETLDQSLKPVSCVFWQSTKPVLSLVLSHGVKLNGMQPELCLTSKNTGWKSVHSLHSTAVVDHETRNQTGKVSISIRK